MIIRNPIKMSFAQRSLAAIRQHEQTKKRRRARFGIKFANVAVYAAVFLLVVSMIYIGYGQPQKTTAVNNVAPTNSTDLSNQPSVDDAVAANIAAGVAQTIDLPIAASVSNLATSVETMSLVVNMETASAVKPQIIESVVESKKVKSYTTAEGDTVSSLATKFGISEQTIRWANDLRDNDTISISDTVKILPVNGVLYTVKTTDTVDSIAERYKIDKTRFVTYNDLEVSGLVANNNIILPDGVLPESEQPGYIAPTFRYSFVNNGNDYAEGNCTWYAYERRKELGNPVSSGLGNANTWDDRSSTGYDHTPSFGAVLVDNGGWYGHVAIVENVDEEGNITISEMNNYAYGGWNIVNTRVISAGQAVLYNYIH